MFCIQTSCSFCCYIGMATPTWTSGLGGGSLTGPNRVGGLCHDVVLSSVRTISFMVLSSPISLIDIAYTVYLALSISRIDSLGLRSRLSLTITRGSSFRMQTQIIHHLHSLYCYKFCLFTFNYHE